MLISIVLLSLLHQFTAQRAVLYETVTDEVYFNVSINGENAGRITIGVFGNVVPLTVRNFVELSRGTYLYNYTGSRFHRGSSDWIQGGDVFPGDGSGIYNIYGGTERYMADENRDLKPYGPGWICMANTGSPNTNGCQFIVLVRNAPYLDGQYTCFAKVVSGMEVVQNISRLPRNNTRIQGDALISDSGVLPLHRPYREPLKGQYDQDVVTEEVFLDIAIGDEEPQRVVVGLLGRSAPITVANFMGLATECMGYGYPGSTFHRIIDGFMIQGGDIEGLNGRGSLSIYGREFADEGFVHNHYGPGWVAMANAGPHTNGCQFYITVSTPSWLDGEHVVFGKVVQGMSYVYQVSRTPRDPNNDRPLVNITIVNSGINRIRSPYFVDQNEVSV